MGVRGLRSTGVRVPCEYLAKHHGVDRARAQQEYTESEERDTRTEIAAHPTKGATGCRVRRHFRCSNLTSACRQSSSSHFRRSLRPTALPLASFQLVGCLQPIAIHEAQYSGTLGVHFNEIS